MPGPFDTTLRQLVQAYPADWLSFLGISAPGPIEIIDTNLQSISAEVDKVIRVGGANGSLVHLEFQTTYDRTMGQRLLRYNAMLHLDDEAPVRSVLVLLRQAADGPAITGTYTITLPGDETYLHFAYAVRRIWQEPADSLLNSPLGTLPLAPLGASTRDALPTLLHAVDERFTAEAPLAEANRLRIMTYTLLGLHFPPAVAEQLMPGIRNMRDSLTYQAIVEEGVERGRAEGLVEGRVAGRVEEARDLVLQLGERRFGPASEQVRGRLGAIADHDRLHALAARLFDAATWEDLIADA